MSGRQAVDMTGERFGRWTVIEKVPKPQFSASTSAFWRCRCDCGTEKIVSATSLRCGDSQSCGCYRTEICSARMKRINALRKRFIENGGKLD